MLRRDLTLSGVSSIELFRNYSIVEFLLFWELPWKDCPLELTTLCPLWPWDLFPLEKENLELYMLANASWEGHTPSLLRLSIMESIFVRRWPWYSLV